MMIENPKWVQGQKRGYFAFWVRLLDKDLSIAVSGFKYFPDSRTVSSPSNCKGDGKFVNTTKLSAELYNLIMTKAQEMLGGTAEEEATAGAA